MAVKLLHIPKARHITTISKYSEFASLELAQVFLANYSIFYLTKQDAYIAYRKAAIDEIGIITSEFISNAGGYHVQFCEIEIIEI